ncbi:hypothetical protein EA472_05050 [Natrarchaeobius oligotrophus]|uniref:Uncharacterized protein n=1 Tax=Natrarchaeobius chitinivorans TaxID=1679083 RepID=A0A3N6N4H9_NATCH|nr:hypothetical protein EA472_05050 [Natrarchaeobius chitinivorans]
MSRVSSVSCDRRGGPTQATHVDWAGLGHPTDERETTRTNRNGSKPSDEPRSGTDPRDGVE